MTTYKLKNIFFEDSSNPASEQNFEKRVCRFCGRTYNEGATFNHISHAISESLGNKHIFTNHECDECNQKFSKLEQHIANFLSGMLYVYGIEGKKTKKNPTGIRKIETPEYKLTEKDGTKVVNAKCQDLIKLVEELEQNRTFSFKTSLKFDKFIPFNVYKSFCKFALSLFDDTDFSHFSKLTNWVNGEGILPFVPKVLMAPFSMTNEHPKFAYFTQQTDSRAPYSVGMFFISYLVFLVEFPSDNIFDNSEVELHIKPLQSLAGALFPNHQFEEIDLSSENLTTMDFRMEINIPAGLKEGKDYFILHSKEDVDRLMKEYSDKTLN